MKKKMDNDAVIVLAVKLFMICLVVSLSIGVVHTITAPKVEETKEQQTKDSMAVILKDAVFEKVTDEVYKGIKNGKTEGYVVSVTTEKGYGGSIDMLVGLSEEYKVLGISFITLPETPGIGTKVQEQSFIDTFIGKKNIEIVKNQSSKDNEIQAITGATISSRAVGEGVQKAVEILKGAIQ